MSSTDLNGKLIEIVDGSGHYEPTPFHMYLAAKHLQESGFDLHQAQMVFRHGVSEVRGLTVPASKFILAMEALTPEQREGFEDVNHSSAKFAEFMEMIRRQTDDPWTIVLLDLYAVRSLDAQNWMTSLKSLAEYVSVPEHREHLDYILGTTFLMRAPRRFAGFPAYFSLPKYLFEPHYAEMKKLFLEQITSDSVKTYVKQWMAEKRIGPKLE